MTSDYAVLIFAQEAQTFTPLSNSRISSCSLAASTKSKSLAACSIAFRVLLNNDITNKDVMEDVFFTRGDGR